MKIEINRNYYLQQQGRNFDLMWVREIEKDGETKKTETNLGYSMSLDMCIKKIAHNELDKRDEMLSLKDWVEEYRKINEEIKEILK